jgi:hypothetical protein
MNVPILARDARVGERNVGQGSWTELSRELSSQGAESWRAKLLGAAFAALILASAILLSSHAGEAANAGGDGALLYPAANLTRVAGTHMGRATGRDTLGVEKTTTREPLVASRHVAWSAKGAG